MKSTEQKKLVGNLLKEVNEIHKKGFQKADHITISTDFIQQYANERGITFDEMLKIIEETLYSKNN